MQPRDALPAALQRSGVSAGLDIESAIVAWPDYESRLGSITESVLSSTS